MPDPETAAAPTPEPAPVEMASEPQIPVTYVPIGSLAEFEKLSRILAATEKVRLALNDKDGIELTLRALNGDAAAEALRFTDIAPPLVYNKESGKDDYDVSAPAYREKLRVGRLNRRAYLIARALADFAVPGKTVEEWRAWLEARFPEALLDTLLLHVERLMATDGRILDLANFTSGAGSTPS